MLRNIIILVIVSLLLSCNTNNSKKIEQGTRNIVFFPDEISKRHSERKIIDIYAQFSECGEWGGHREYLNVTTKNDGNFYLEYKKYCVDCDNMVEYRDSIGSAFYPYRKIIDSCKIKMEQTHKNKIYEFAQLLLKSKFREKFPGHAGNNFSIIKHEGFGSNSFYIDVYSFDKELENGYYNLIKNLKLPSILEDVNKNVPCEEINKQLYYDFNM